MVVVLIVCKVQSSIRHVTDIHLSLRPNKTAGEGGGGSGVNVKAKRK